jgi:hypothetical protein
MSQARNDDHDGEKQSSLDGALDVRSHSGSTPPSSMKSYRAPRLRLLGSVRDLTFGATGGVFDGPGSQRP